jgi:SAM-dependent methyltransferase
VRKAYGRIAGAGKGCGCSGKSGCCGAAAPQALARSIGYTSDELSGVPEAANLGLSCGNPTALASLKEGEVVLDLGSGAGLDVFIAGRKVGARGRAIGVDMTAKMVDSARRNTAAYERSSGLNNVEFRLGEIEHLPVADETVDVVISNCVINLSPDKPQVWREIARVLKPGGRVAVSDIALLKPLPAEVAQMVEALVGCIAGAAFAKDIRTMAKDAGLTNVRLKSNKKYVNAVLSATGELYRKVTSKLPRGASAGDYVTSLEVSAVRPK